MNWMLLIVLLILAGYALSGLKQGFIKTVFSICSFVVALIITMVISPQIGQALQSNEKVFDYTITQLEKVIPEKESLDEEDKAQYLESINLPDSIKNGLLKNDTVESYEKLAIHSFREYIINYLACTILNSLAYLVTFIIISIILSVLCSVLNVISKLPILKQVNKLAGVFVGLLQGLLMVWCFFIVLTIFSGTAFGQAAFEMIDNNEILGIIYNNNILLNYVINAMRIFL